jgi:hypothetical protein
MQAEGISNEYLLQLEIYCSNIKRQLAVIRGACMQYLYPAVPYLDSTSIYRAINLLCAGRLLRFLHSPALASVGSSRLASWFITASPSSSTSPSTSCFPPPTTTLTSTSRSRHTRPAPGFLLLLRPSRFLIPPFLKSLLFLDLLKTSLSHRLFNDFLLPPLLADDV